MASIIPCIIKECINFKGEGVDPKEKYLDVGWGLSQVLQNMDYTRAVKNPVNEFVQSAKITLANRISASPIWKNEERWREGWYNRMNNYLNL